ncbi:MAG: serine hydrolase [Pseudomonadota bacterium]
MRLFLCSFVAASCLGLMPAGAKPWNACGEVKVWPGREWQASAPAAHGWDLEALTDAKSKFEILQSASVMLVHQGRLIAEWGDSAERLTAQSVRKGLLNSLVGVLVDDNKLSVDMTLEDLGIDDSDPPLSATEQRASLRHLLRSRSGIYHSALYEVGGWKRMRAVLAAEKAEEGGHEPGAYWFYNNWDFNAVGTIVEQTADKSIGAFFQTKMARPLKMQDFRPSDVEYTTKSDVTEKRFNNVSDHRAYMFNISTRDLARYGLMYLGCGKWGSRQIVSRAWVLESLDGVDTKIGRPPEQIETGFGDYGYLWQIDRPGSRRFRDMKTREPVYFATGNRGHMLAVFPYLDLVIAHQVGTRGGVSAPAQIKRARQGSPEVTHEEMTALFNAIIAAHPEAETAYGPE